MDNAVIYARVSSRDQEVEGFSIPSQLKTTQEYADKHHLLVVQIFTDVETAKKTGRIQFNQMVKYLKENSSVKNILVEKTDRLSRNLLDFALADQLMEQSNVRIHLIKENTVIGKDSRSSEKLMFGFKAVMSKHYSDNLSEEVRKGMLEKAAQGAFPSKAAYGYINTRDGDKKIIAIDPKSGHIIKKIFDLYATGSHSLLTLRKKMIEDGLIYRGGKQFYCSTLETILKNDFYTGNFWWQGKLYENGQHEPLISKELYARVQQILRSPYKSKSRKGIFTYANLIRCDACNCKLTAEIKKERYIYYHCTNKKGGCKKNYLKQEFIEEQFDRLLSSITIDDVAREIILEGLRSSMQSKIDYHNNTTLQLEKQIKVIQNRIDQAYLDKLDAKISEEFWHTQTRKYVSEKENLHIKLLALQKADIHYLENANLMLELVNKATRLFKTQNQDLKRRVINLLTSNCYYKDEALDIELKSVFSILLKSGQNEKWWS